MLLPATDYEATYRVTAPFKLPHHAGSLLRGLLGRALRRTACALASASQNSSPCPGECQLPTECTCARLFDPRVPSPAPHRFLQAGREAPPRLLPLLPPVHRLDLSPGDALSFGVRALGALNDDDERRLTSALSGIDDLPFGAAGGAVESTGVTRHGHRNRDVIAAVTSDPDADPASVLVRFETPAWLDHHRKLVDTLTFPVLFRALYRRLTVLCALHGELDERDDDAFDALDALAAGVAIKASTVELRAWERYSQERAERHPMRG